MLFATLERSIYYIFNVVKNSSKNPDLRFLLRYSVAKIKIPKNQRKSIFATLQRSKNGILGWCGPHLTPGNIILIRKKCKCETKNRQKIRLRRLRMRFCYDGTKNPEKSVFATLQRSKNFQKITENATLQRSKNELLAKMKP